MIVSDEFFVTLLLWMVKLQVTGERLSMIKDTTIIKGELDNSTIIRWRAMPFVGETLSHLTLYRPGNRGSPEVSGLLSKFSLDTWTHGKLKDRIKLFYLPINESNYYHGGEFRIQIKNLKFRENYNFTLDVMFSVGDRLRVYHNTVSTKSITDTVFVCNSLSMNASNITPRDIIINEDNTGEVLFTNPLCMRGSPKPHLRYWLNGLSSSIANYTSYVASKDQYKFTKIPIRISNRSICGRRLSFQFIGSTTSYKYDGTTIWLKFNKPVIGNITVKRMFNNTVISWEDKDNGRCSIVGYLITVKNKKGKQTDYFIQSQTKFFTLPSEDVKYFKIKALFTDSKAIDDSNYWYDVDYPVDYERKTDICRLNLNSEASKDCSKRSYIIIISCLAFGLLLFLICIIYLLCVIKRQQKRKFNSSTSVRVNDKNHYEDLVLKPPSQQTYSTATSLKETSNISNTDSKYTALNKNPDDSTSTNKKCLQFLNDDEKHYEELVIKEARIEPYTCIIKPGEKKKMDCNDTHHEGMDTNDDRDNDKINVERRQHYEELVINQVQQGQYSSITKPVTHKSIRHNFEGYEVSFSECDKKVS